MKIRLVISRPAEEWLGSTPAKTGYWGFVRTREDYEKEISAIQKEFETVIDALREEGKDIDLLPSLEIKGEDDVLHNIANLQQPDVNIILIPGMPGNPVLTDFMDLTYSLVSNSRYSILFDRVKPNIYMGTLFSPPTYQTLKRHRRAQRVFLVEEDWEKLKSILRGIYGLVKISSAQLVSVGPVNKAFGGWVTFGKGSELFGYKTTFYTYDDFVEKFNNFFNDPLRREQAEKVCRNFTQKATRIVEPTHEKLLRAGVYYLVLDAYIKEHDADWVTVNCLSELVKRVEATPCMAFSIFNDSGIVATCEADPTEMPLHYIMRHIASRPAFFVDPTINEKDGTIILAHCTSPTKLLGFDSPSFTYEVRTHHETNYGATPKPTFQEGEVTVAGLSAELDKMLIIKGKVIGTPNLRICRSQVEIEADNVQQILEDWQGFHWALVYGDYTKELQLICKTKAIEPIVYL